MKGKTTRLVVTLAALLLLLLAMERSSFAEKRKYVWTIEYETLAKGFAGLEYYYDVSTPDFGNFEGITTERHQIELKVGMRDNWNMRVSQIFVQEPYSPLHHSAFMIQSRYRLGEKGSYLLDPTIIVDYSDRGDFSHHMFHVFAALSKDFGRLNITFNPILEIEENPVKDEMNYRGRYAVGMSYAVERLLNVGLEFQGSEFGHYFGPTISHGGSNYWIALGSGFKIGSVDPGRPEFQLRTIVGIHF